MPTWTAPSPAPPDRTNAVWPMPVSVRTTAVSYPGAMAQTYSFSAVLWIWAEAKGSWHFVTLPAELSDEIEEQVGDAARGFGSVPVEVSLGPTTWRTSIFPSKS